jgi:hypothetical protein
MARLSKQQICLKLEALNACLKSPVNYAEDEPYDDLVAKLKSAEEQMDAKPKPVKKKENHVSFGRGNDEYGKAINDLMDRVAALESK